MTPLRDIAWAKVNLTLSVLGRRVDGFHEVESLVAFAGFGDTVEFAPGGPLDVAVEGPFAGALCGDNLILQAADAAKAIAPGLRLGRFRLVKLLPVAAGLGGGSGDAAAALRLIARANEAVFTAAMAAEIAPKLGSDVSVCLESRPALITGRGENVSAARGFPACGVLLANPGVPLATAAVYAELGTQPLASPPDAPVPPDFAGDFEMLLGYIAPRGNDLERPALRLAPVISQVLDRLRALESRFIRMSGSGPTCFALFATEREAHGAATALAQIEPNWWIAAGALGEPRLT